MLMKAWTNCRGSLRSFHGTNTLRCSPDSVGFMVERRESDNKISAVLTATQLKLWFAPRRKDGFELGEGFSEGASNRRLELQFRFVC
jgi:hypothetical protein